MVVKRLAVLLFLVCFSTVLLASEEYDELEIVKTNQEVLRYSIGQTVLQLVNILEILLTEVELPETTVMVFRQSLDIFYEVLELLDIPYGRIIIK